MLTDDVALRETAVRVMQALLESDGMAEGQRYSPIPGWRRIDCRRGHTFRTAKDKVLKLKLLWHADKTTAKGVGTEALRRMHLVLAQAWEDMLEDFARARKAATEATDP